MKKKSINSKLFSFIVTVFVIIIFSSCSKKMVFTRSSVVPAAQGSVKVKRDKNKNYAIEVYVTNLAPASQLTPPKKTYLVWVVTESNGSMNVGQLISDTGFLSKSLKGSLSTVTSFNPMSIFITAEDEGDVQYPGVVVLNTRH